MGNFVNPGNDAFQATLNAKIYVDKSGLLNYTNSVLASTDAYICNAEIYLYQPSKTFWKINYGQYAYCLLQQRL